MTEINASVEVWTVEVWKQFKRIQRDWSMFSKRKKGSLNVTHKMENNMLNASNKCSIRHKWQTELRRYEGPRAKFSFVMHSFSQIDRALMKVGDKVQISNLTKIPLCLIPFKSNSCQNPKTFDDVTFQIHNLYIFVLRHLFTSCWAFWMFTLGACRLWR